MHLGPVLHTTCCIQFTAENSAASAAAPVAACPCHLPNGYRPVLAQVLLRWGLQQGAAVIPKSTSPARIVGFAPDVLLSPAAHIPDALMSQLDAVADGHKYCWDPAGIV